MKFWDREKEKKWLKHYLLTEPNAILFVYGPKSSGKTTLLMKVVEELADQDKFLKEYDVYWYDLRGIVVGSYEDVLNIFFEDAESEALKEVEREFGIGIPNVATFKVKRKVMEEIKRKEVDAFRYMERRMAYKGKRGIIVFDELQKLKDIYLNGESQRPLIKELFNFFVRLTKVLHLAHVIVMTSDTFFIEQVYTDSTLENTSRFYLVDYFDDETTKKILISEGISEKDAEHISKEIGGVPWIIEEILESSEPYVVIENLRKQISSRMFEVLRGKKKLKDLLKRVLNGENLYYLEGEYDELRELVEKELLFMDPINKVVKFHTKLHELAARELLEVK